MMYKAAALVGTVAFVHGHSGANHNYGWNPNQGHHGSKHLAHPNEVKHVDYKAYHEQSWYDCRRDNNGWYLQVGGGPKNWGACKKVNPHEVSRGWFSWCPNDRMYKWYDAPKGGQGYRGYGSKKVQRRRRPTRRHGNVGHRSQWGSRQRENNQWGRRRRGNRRGDSKKRLSRTRSNWGDDKKYDSKKDSYKTKSNWDDDKKYDDKKYDDKKYGDKKDSYKTLSAWGDDKKYDSKGKKLSGYRSRPRSGYRSPSRWGGDRKPTGGSYRNRDRWGGGRPSRPSYGGKSGRGPYSRGKHSGGYSMGKYSSGKNPKLSEYTDEATFDEGFDLEGYFDEDDVVGLEDYEAEYDFDDFDDEDFLYEHEFLDGEDDFEEEDDVDADEAADE